MSFQSIVIHLPESGNFWVAITALATIIAIALQVWFNIRTLKISNAQHEKNLKYQEKIALFKERFELIKKLSDPSQFVHKITKVDIVVYDEKNLSINDLQGFTEDKAKNSAIIEESLLEIHNIIVVMDNNLNALFKSKLSSEFSNQISKIIQYAYKLHNSNNNFAAIKCLIEIQKSLKKIIPDLIASLTDESKIYKE